MSVSTITPPRWIERLLASLGARPEYTEAVLGDMHEELVFRAALDGAQSARRWYLMEALRSSPYLVRDWIRHLTPLSAGHAVAAAFLAGIASFVGFSALRTALVMAQGVSPDGLGIVMFAWRDILRDYPVLGPIAVVIDFSEAFVTGALAARLYRRAPLAGTFTLVALSAASLALATVGNDGSAVTNAQIAAIIVRNSVKFVSGGLLVALMSRRAATREEQLHVTM